MSAPSSAGDLNVGGSVSRRADEAPGVASVPAAARVPRFLVVGAQWAWRSLIVALAIYVTLRVLSTLRFVVVPIFIALVVASLLAPLVGVVGRVMPRLAATWIVIIGTAGAVVAAIALAAGPVVDSARDLLDRSDEALDEVRNWLRTGPFGLDEQQVDDLFDQIGDTAGSVASGLTENPATTAMLAFEFVGGFLLAVVLTFFFVKDGGSMWSWFVRQLRPARQPIVDEAGRAAVSNLRRWVRGTAITGVADATLIGSALWILDVPAALPLTILTFFATFLPIIGATIAGALAAGVALADSGPQTAIIVVIVVIAVQQIEGDILLPLVMRRQVALHPAAILVALAVGAAVGGILGALVAVPVTAAGVAAISSVRAGPSGRETDDEPGDDAAGGADPQVHRSNGDAPGAARRDGDADHGSGRARQRRATAGRYRRFRARPRRGAPLR